MAVVVWSIRAQDRLDQIKAHIGKDQPINAERFIDKLIRLGDTLSDNVYKGRVVEEYADSTIRELIKDSYRIIYRIRSDSRITVLTVRHNARLLPSKIRSL